MSSEFEAKLARVLVKQCADFSQLERVERLTGGANQETYRIVYSGAEREKVIALRRAAGGSAEQTSEENIGLNNEARLIGIANQYGVPTPKILYELNEADGLGAGFLMEWLTGETRGARIVRHEKYANLRRSLAYECGKLLAKIHAINIQTNRLDEFLPERTPQSFVHSTWDRYKALDTPQPMLDYTALWLLDNLPKSSRYGLVHNDFRNGNLMVNEHEIVAVLDWEVAHLGDPYRDLGWICTGSWRFGEGKPVGGFGDREELFKGYEKQSGVVVDYEDVKFWEVFGSFWWGVGCLLMAQQYRDGPDPSVERPGIGRRSSECQMDCANLIIPGAVDAVADCVPADDQLPNASELLRSVAAFLRDEVMEETEGRVNFLARVAANSLDIAEREQRLGAMLHASELERLQSLLGGDADLSGLRWRLVRTLRDGSADLRDERLQQHLRQTVYDNLAIDQPSYPAFKLAEPQP